MNMKKQLLPDYISPEIETVCADCEKGFCQSGLRHSDFALDNDNEGLNWEN